MPRTLTENIDRGRRAIAAAHRDGMDTTVWQERLAELELEELLAWANQLAERDVILGGTVEYLEAPLRTVTTDRVSSYAVTYLKTISFARLNQATGGWGLWTPEWWNGRELEAIRALEALRTAVEGMDDKE